MRLIALTLAFYLLDTGEGLLPGRRPLDNEGSGTVQNYSYVGHDYPRVWPIDELEVVHKAVEDTVHYTHSSDLGRNEWATTVPPGDVFLHLGPQRRQFSISMFHQLRCLDILGNEATVRVKNEVPSPLARHYMNYLRQMILCRANTRLEPGWNAHGPTIVVWSQTHTCKDWTAVYAAAEDNHKSMQKEKP